MINIEKAEAVLGEISVVYSDCFDIAKDIESILKRAITLNGKRLLLKTLVVTFSNFIAELWKVHPFRGR